MSDSVQPQKRQLTRLPCPWDSPGKNTGVGCHFLLQCMKVKSESEVIQSYPTIRDPMDCSLPGSSIHRIFQARVLEWGAIAFSVCFLLSCKDSPKQDNAKGLTACLKCERGKTQRPPQWLSWWSHPPVHTWKAFNNPLLRRTLHILILCLLK